MAADVVEVMTGEAGEVDVHFELPDDVREDVDHARATTDEAKRLTPLAAFQYSQAVLALVVDRDMSNSDVKALLNVPRQRTSQLAPLATRHAAPSTAA